MRSTFNTITIDNYLNNHPNSSLEDFREYLNTIESERIKSLKDSENRHRELIKSFENKCFRIDFNSQSVLYFKIKENILNVSPIKVDAYNVLINSDNISMSLEKGRVINLCWFPGQEEWFGASNEKSEIISDDCFNKIVNEYNIFFDMAKRVKDGYNSL